MEYPCFVLGGIAGIIFSVLILMHVPVSKWHQAIVAVDQCEFAMPRNLHCIVTAQPAPAASEGGG